MQIINQLNEKIQILESHITTKDTKERSTELSIVVPSSDEMTHHRGKVIKTKQNSCNFTLRKNISAKTESAE